jgi:hypothetical protein
MSKSSWRQNIHLRRNTATDFRLEDEEPSMATHLQDLDNVRQEQDITDDRPTPRADEAVQRRLEMARWTQDWQQAGEWLLSGGSSPVESWYSSSTQHGLDGEQQVGWPGRSKHAAASMNKLSAEAACGISEERLEKKRSLRLRVRRGVSDGYVLALRTVAAVRRAASAT